MIKKSKNTTLNDLAGMVARGFSETNERMEKNFKEVHIHLKGIDSRLDRIEDSILQNHAQQILMLEKRIQRMENLFAIK